MFGQNQRVGQAYFDDALTQKLLVTTIFRTIQGEGPYRGHRSIFIRLAKCNLACYFCDTYFDAGAWMDCADIYKAILEQLPEGHTLNSYGLVITGGEPMLQKNLVGLIENLSPSFKWVQIESNGVILQPIPGETTLVVSPKCSEIEGLPNKYLKLTSRVLERADCLKFVLKAPDDELTYVNPYSSIPDWALDWKRATGRDIFVSPMNIYNQNPVKTSEMSIEERAKVDEVVSWWTPDLLNMTDNQRNHEYAAAYALEHGLVAQVQLHLFASLA